MGSISFALPKGHFLGVAGGRGPGARLFASSFRPSLDWHVGGMDICGVSTKVLVLGAGFLRSISENFLVDLMERKQERRLIFLMGPEWAGWYCQRCCWSRQLPANLKERGTFANRIEPEFRAHDCDQFSNKNWTAAASGSC